MLPDRRERPRWQAGAAHHATYTTNIMATTPEDLTLDEALVVIVETPAGRQRRRCYLSLKGATAAVARARAAGQPVALVLCALVPVSSGDLALVDVEIDGAL